MYVYVVYLKILNYHSIYMVQFFLQNNLKGTIKSPQESTTSKNQVFDCAIVVLCMCILVKNTKILFVFRQIRTCI